MTKRATINSRYQDYHFADTQHYGLRHKETENGSKGRTRTPDRPKSGAFSPVFKVNLPLHRHYPTLHCHCFSLTVSLSAT
jgi:hypothetical protein